MIYPLIMQIMFANHFLRSLMSILLHLSSYKREFYNILFFLGKRDSHVADRSNTYSVHASDHSVEVISDITYQKGASALDLLASVYGDLSDSDDEVLDGKVVFSENNMLSICSHYYILVFSSLSL